MLANESSAVRSSLALLFTQLALPFPSAAACQQHCAGKPGTMSAVIIYATLL